MFGPFKKKKPLSGNPDLAKIVAIAAKIAAVQIALASIPPYRLATDIWSLGYIFGMHDAILQRGGKTDQAECLAAITMGFHQVFGGDVAPSAVRKCLDLQQDPVFAAGMTVGGTDLYAFLQNRTSAPMALFDHINDLGGR